MLDGMLDGKITIEMCMMALIGYLLIASPDPIAKDLGYLLDGAIVLLLLVNAWKTKKKKR